MIEQRSVGTMTHCVRELPPLRKYCLHSSGRLFTEPKARPGIVHYFVTDSDDDMDHEHEPAVHIERAVNNQVKAPKKGRIKAKIDAFIGTIRNYCN